MKPIPREVAEKYIEQYFKKRWLVKDSVRKLLRVNEKLQPNFWEAVILLCEDINTDVSGLEDTSSDYKGFFLLTRYKDEEFSIGNAAQEGYFDDSIETFSDLAKYIALQIIEAESRPADSTNLRLFLLERRVEELANTVYR